MARTSRLENADYAKTVAEAYNNGMSHNDMADEFGVTPHTIGSWVRDPRVQAHAARFAQERINRITRKIDSEIEERLDEVKDMDIEVMLKVRKEFLDRAMKVDIGKAGQTPETINEVVGTLEENPDLARELKEMLANRRKG